MSPPNPLGRRCHVPGCNAWALRDSDPPTCVSHAGLNPGGGARRGKRKPRATTFDSLAPGLADLLTWGTRRGVISREERARLRAAHAAAVAQLDDESADVTDEEAVRGLALLAQTFRSLAWDRFGRRYTPPAHLEKLDDVADLLLDDWSRPRRRRR
jgi:hypothetical protein